MNALKEHLAVRNDEITLAKRHTQELQSQLAERERRLECVTKEHAAQKHEFKSQIRRSDMALLESEQKLNKLTLDHTSFKLTIQQLENKYASLNHILEVRTFQCHWLQSQAREMRERTRSCIATINV
eukprot:Lithocolla_globosa_v1_NODE_346_length_4383_cov_46.262055.p6 type:complete len:127 gc:universal NODE_346_length_4383_cov_46.262055:1816-2196(+)